MAADGNQSGMAPLVINNTSIDFDYGGQHFTADPAAAPPSPQRLKAGDTDPLGDAVVRILMQSNDFDIYETTNKVRYRFHSTSQHEKEMLEAYYPFVDEICLIEDLVCGLKPTLCITPAQERHYLRLKSGTRDVIAKIMASCFDGYNATAMVLTRNVLSDLRTRRDSANRMRYIWANIAGFIVFLSIVRSIDISNFHLQRGDQYLDVITFGILGAFFSVSVGLKEVKIKHSITFAEMLYAGFIRIPIGIIGAIVVIVLVEGNWILGMLNDTLKNWGLYLFGFLAGFSELFIPNALKQVEQSTSIGQPAGGGPPAPGGQARQ